MESDGTGRIREAIASEDYGAALSLWNDFAAQLRSEVSRGVASRERMTQMRELFEWSRVALLCARAQNQDRLNAFRVAAVYAGKT
jgi:hypothetical protein